MQRQNFILNHRMKCISFLKGDIQDTRLKSITFSLCTELLVNSKICNDMNESKKLINSALESGKAAEKFSQMVSALGGPTDIIENPENQNISRQLTKPKGWKFLQGTKTVSGELLGGCFDVLETLKDTKLWVTPSDWKGKILFFETSEAMMPPHYFLWILRNYVASGIIHNIKGLIVGRPYNNQYVVEYEKALIQVIRDEAGLTDLPIITEMDFGHTCPTFTIPYGIKAEINPVDKTFSIIESALTN